MLAGSLEVLIAMVGAAVNVGFSLAAGCRVIDLRGPWGRIAAGAAVVTVMGCALAHQAAEEQRAPGAAEVARPLHQ